MKQRILIMGLPGSGKTYLAEALKKYLEQHGTRADYGEMLPITGFAATVTWFNADDVRRKYNDWDFSNEGRIRQSLRMLEFALTSATDYVICDFVAPIPEMRNNFKADWTIWVDTIEAGRFEDTNKMFVPPDVYDFRVTEKNAERWAEFIGSHIIDDRRRPRFDWQKETVQQLGRWQPWHKGHQWLIEQRLKEGKNVWLAIRDVPTDENNPYTAQQVLDNLTQEFKDLINEKKIIISIIPDIESVNYGRGVGYEIIEHIPPTEIKEISATKIRKQLRDEGKL